MTLVFRVLVGLNALLLAFTLFYRSSGEDPAGEGMRMGFAAVYLVSLAVVLAIYQLVKWQPVRVVMLALLCLPVLITLYGVTLMLQ